MTRLHPRIAVLVIALLAACGVGIGAPAAAGTSELRRIEAVGVVPVDPATRMTSPPRDRAIHAAMREGVEQVAYSLVGIDPDAKPEDSSATPRQGGGGPRDGGDAAPVSAGEVRAALGDDLVKFTSRFRILEDRGERPALFVQDREFETEYLVVVEVFVDVERVRRRLVDNGLLAADTPAGDLGGIRLLANGIGAYPGYEALRSFLLEKVGAESVTPLEFRQERVLLEVRSAGDEVALAERMRRQAPPTLEIELMRSEPLFLEVAVRWLPALAETPEARAGWSRRSEGGASP